jgi:hypothetical protein
VCGRLSTSSYCPAHRPRRPSRFNRAKRGGSGWAASRFRARVLAEHGAACVVCGSSDGVEAHHIGPLDEDGGVPLCLRCHREVTKAEARARRAGNL